MQKKMQDQIKQLGEESILISIHLGLLQTKQFVIHCLVQYSYISTFVYDVTIVISYFRGMF